MLGVLFGLHCGVIGGFFLWKGGKGMGEIAAPRAACAAGACFVSKADGHSLCIPLQSKGRESKLCPWIKVPHTERCDTMWHLTCLPCFPAQSFHLRLCRWAVQRGKHTLPSCVKTPLLEGNPGCSLSQRCSNTLQLDFWRVKEVGMCTASLCTEMLCLSKAPADGWSFPWQCLQEWYQIVMKFGSIIVSHMWSVYSESQLMKEPESKEVLAALILSRFL